jgi:hypothetical protein
VNIGAVNQRCIVEGGGLVAFYSSSNEDDRGFFITNGGRPVPISHSNTRPIKKWVEAIPAANESAIAGWATNKGFAWSVGDLTVDGRTYANVVLHYNRLLNQWSVRSYPTQFTCFANYIVSGVNAIVAGDEDGTVFRIDKADTFSDNGTAIQWEVRDHKQDWGFNQKKQIIDRVVIRSQDADGATVSAVVDGADQIQLGQLSGIATEIPIERDVRGTTIAMTVSGTTTNKRAILQEIELPGIELDSNYA